MHEITCVFQLDGERVSRFYNIWDHAEKEEEVGGGGYWVLV